MSDDHDFPPTKDARHNIRSSGWTITENEFTDASGAKVYQVAGAYKKHRFLAKGATIHEAWKWAHFEAAKTGTLKRIVWRKNNDALRGYYEAELDAPIGIIKLSCTDVSFLQEDKMKKWFWKVEWPGGETADGGTPTLSFAQNRCETAAKCFEPFGDGFRKKEGYV